MDTLIYGTIGRHLLLLIVQMMEGFLDNYGALGVTTLTALLLFGAIAGVRLHRLCSPERALLLYIPRTFGWCSSTLALAMSAAIVIVLFAVPGFVPVYEPENATVILQQWQDYVLWSRKWLICGGIVGAYVSAIGWYLIGRWLEPWCAEKLQLGTKKREQVGLTDVRELHSSLPQSRQFDPRKYFPEAHKKDSIFLGLDENNAPVYLSRAKFRKTHGQFQGLTGSGKSVAATVILSQCVRYGDAVFVFDPKDDEWAPYVLSTECRAAGVPFHVLDLRSTVPLVNLFGSASSAQINELLIAGFGLSRTGGDSDYYRIDDRKAARMLAYSDECKSCVAQMSDAAHRVLGEELTKSAKGLLGQLEELAELPVIQTSAGFDIDAFVRKGGCLYVIGSIADEAIITLQRMLFVRVMQIVSARSRMERRRHVCIFLDEFKYLLSVPALAALGTIRDKGANLLLAHQSLGDFANCGPTMPAASVRAVIVDNTGFKWLYRAKDSETAAFISGMTGKILVTQERYTVNRNDALAEVAESQRMVEERERALIDVNSVQHLADGAAVFISDGIAKLAFASPIRVTKGQLPTAPPALIFPRSATKDDPFAGEAAFEVPDSASDPFAGGAE